MAEHGHFSLGTFLNAEEREAVKRAVEEAESKTAGEIRVLVAERSRRPLSRTPVEEAVEKRAEKEFLSLGIDKTVGHTGILIMISLRERRVCVKADKAIHDLVGDGAWRTAVEKILAGVKVGRQCAGLCEAVAHVGDVLAQHFPRKPDDKNELPNEVKFEK